MEGANIGRAGIRGRVRAITLFGAYLVGIAILVSLPGDMGYAGSLLSEKGDPTTQQGNCWQTVPRPSTGDGYNQLYGTTALSADDMWVVGTHGAHTLVEHWDGTAWSVVPSPGPDNRSVLHGVAAVAAEDVWAVGYYGIPPLGSEQTLAEHWDGSSWTIVPTPDFPDDNRSFLQGVAAVSADDVWAVGYYGPTAGGVMHTLVEHWDGTAWSVVPSPERDSSVLLAVAAVAADDVWAVGYSGIPPLGSEQTLAEHWDGSSWTIVPTPDFPDDNRSFLQGVAAVSANDVWAVGYYGSTAGGVMHTLVEHWDGTAWSVIPTPAPRVASYLYGITAVSADDVWAVGHYFPEPGEGPNQTLVEHWDGSSWTIVSSPNVGSGPNYLEGVSAVSANDVWAVGYYATGIAHYPPTRTLIMHWDGSSWTIVSSANPDKINNDLYAVAGVPAYGVWAVGGYGRNDPGLVAHQPLVETYICRAPPDSTNLQMPMP